MPRSLSPSDAGPIVSVRAIEDLASALPHLLGFTPAESLVVVAIEGPRDELTFTLRLDLPGPDDIDAVVRICAARMHAAAADSVLAFIVTEAQDRAPGQLPGGELVEALQRAVPMPLRDAFLLRGGRIWSLLCPDPDCCPADGRPIDDSSPVATTLAAAGVVAGRPVYRDRDEIVRAALPVGGAETAAVSAAVARLLDGAGGEPSASAVREAYATALPALLARCAERGADLDPEEAALLGCGWHHMDLRDDMLFRVANGEAGADTLIRAVARLLPAPYDAPVAAMLGWVAYAEGSGVLAAAALARALATDPRCSLALLLNDALDRQVPPSALLSVWARFADNADRGDPPQGGSVRRRRPARGR